MRLLHVLLGLTLIVGSGAIVYGQSRPKKPTKPKTITATVTVKADPPIKPLPKETDESSWTQFESKENGLAILFPGTADDINDDTTGPVQTFDVSTEKAHYMLAIRDLGGLIDAKDTQAYLDETIDNAFGADERKFLYRRAISYAGRVGREFGHVDRGKRFAARVYVLNGKLFIISVTVKTTGYTPAFDKWINKFFDSFNVRMPKIEA
jgi:hypothetical protein